MSKNKLYEEIPAGYYYYAFKRGNTIQRFWHKYKFSEIISSMGLKNKKILDVGCGPGVLLSLMPQIYNSALGLDLSKKQISFARKKFASFKKIKWVAKDLKDMHFKRNSFDYVVSSEVIEHIPKKASLELLKKMKEIVKKNGMVIITTPNYMSLWPFIEFAWNKMAKVSYEEQHINRLTRSKMKDILKKAGFRKIRIRTFFIISPFLSVLSERLAKAVMKIEKKVFPSAGSIMIVEAS